MRLIYFLLSETRKRNRRVFCVTMRDKTRGRGGGAKYQISSFLDITFTTHFLWARLYINSKKKEKRGSDAIYHINLWHALTFQSFLAFQQVYRAQSQE